MRPIEIILVFGEVSSLLFALTITYFANRAYSRSGSTAVRSLMIGFGSLTLGIVLGVVLFALIGVDIVIGVSVQSVFMAIGLGLLTYSLYIQDANLGRRTGPNIKNSPVDQRRMGR